MSENDAHNEWVTRVLGFQFGPANGAAQRDSASPKSARGRKSGVVRYRTMLLKWREAQGRLSANIGALGKAVLAREDVKGDPRFAEVQAAVAKLPDLIPKFGGTLEDILDRGLNAGPGADGKRLAAEAIQAVDAYRKQVDGASQLAALEELAQDELKQDIPMHKLLDGALQDLRAELERQA